MFTGFIWFKIESRAKPLWTWQWNFGFHERWGISWPAEWLSVSQGELCSI